MASLNPLVFPVKLQQSLSMPKGYSKTFFLLKPSQVQSLRYAVYTAVAPFPPQVCAGYFPCGCHKNPRQKLGRKG